MISPLYRAQVELLLRLLPEVEREEVFALKGGTAINLFAREMPRLSVDIDLTYLPLQERSDSLREIAAGLHRIKQRLEQTAPDVSVRVPPQGDGHESKLTCRRQSASVKIEVNQVMRGHLWPVRQLTLTEAAQREFGMFAAAQVVSHGELFGGKICAALDRQHPRDLFDIQQLLASEGLSNEVRLGFLAARMSHTRPMHELLRPQRLDQRRVFETQFAGMTLVSFTYEDLEATREALLRDLHSALRDQEKELLLSLKRGEPRWDLFPITALPKLPAVKWKLRNIEKLKQNSAKHSQQLRALEDALTSVS